MVHSTWSDWLVSEIESAAVDGMSLWYLGCNGFVVRSPEATLYIDPYFGDGDPPTLLRMIPVPMDPADATECDAVLVTHEHVDHMHPPSLDPLLEDDGTAYAPEASFETYDADAPLALPDARREVVAPGDRFEIGDLTVHVRAATDPDAIEPVTYVIEGEAGTFFHGGDTKPADSFERLGTEFDIDVGVLAMGSEGRVAGEDGPDTVEWYMGADEVVEAANALRLDRLVPSHWDMWRGVEGDPTVLADHAASFEYPRVLEPVRIGDRVDLDAPGVVTSSSLR
jgi:L-ascorbate 6-phosphate lactonase